MTDQPQTQGESPGPDTVKPEQKKPLAITILKVNNGYLLSGDSFPRSEANKFIAATLEEAFNHLKDFFK